MPELPEVETIRRDLTPRIAGRTVAEAWVSPDAPKLVQGEAADAFCRRLAGRRVEELDRRGKSLLIRLQGGLTWIVHLRMTGGLIHLPAGRHGSRGGCPEERFLRARFRLDDGSHLCYVDLRKLGTLWLGGDGAAAGGAVWGAGGRARRPGKALPRRAAERLHRAVRKVLVEALEDRGSSFRDYVDAGGGQGMHQLRGEGVRRTGEPCYVCGTAIKRVRVGGRSTHYCPKCQR